MRNKCTVAEAVERIAGREASPVYARGKPGGSPLASALRDVLLGADLSALTGAQLDHLRRVLSGGLAGVLAFQDARHYHVRRWIMAPALPP
jgi:hypothetical protein